MLGRDHLKSMDQIFSSKTKEITPIKGRILMGISNNLQDDAGEAVITNLLRAGFEALALGADLNPSQYIKALRKFSPQVLILFWANNTSYIKKLIQAIKQVGMRSRLRIVVYGPDIKEITRDEVHADACANDKQELLDIVNEILSNPSHGFFQ